MKLASIQIITDIRPIAGADRIEAATVLGYQTLEEFGRATGLPTVRTVWRGEFRFTLPELVALASAQDYTPGQPAEGIVIRPLEEARSRILESGRLSAKVISERYALKHGE